MHAINRLAGRGMIRTEVIKARRRIFACRIGKWTGFSVIGCGASNWIAAQADVLRLRVERDPCPMCGIRRDVGCRHGKGLSDPAQMTKADRS
jgi:hypothetical protein